MAESMARLCWSADASTVRSMTLACRSNARTSSCITAAKTPIASAAAIAVVLAMPSDPPARSSATAPRTAPAMSPARATETEEIVVSRR
ncbi:hypothetical protein [Asanoa ferruginea]|uniref:hypothetical protein n=1 Tax=Asanoa ferruginea TaxID=53367 RepID=UPI0011C17304|nr:hypothetical protein [Asanoa ferruginea]